MNNSPKIRRVTYKLKNPNPLFEKWLNEWKEEAIAKDSKLKYSFMKALESLRKYPLPLDSGKDCAILQGFGDTICLMLDKKLETYLASKVSSDESELIDLPVIEYVDRNIQATKRKSPLPISPKKTKKASSSKAYLPAPRSAPYAILLTLLKHHKNGIEHMSKGDIQTSAQCLCDKSFTKTDGSSRYTAWSSMTTLVNKGFVNRLSNPVRFSLTDEGKTLAEQLKKIHSDLNEKIANESSDNSSDVVIVQTECPEFGEHVVTESQHFQLNDKPFSQGNFEDEVDYESIIFHPNTFKILLIVDTAETSGQSKKLYDATIQELEQSQVTYEVRKLNIGDFTWICRNSDGHEVVLPYIVERKRTDDFGSSIKDGRFHEQKFRLKQSGVQNQIYLVESYGNNQHTGLPMSTILQAATNTHVQDGFTLKFTNNHRESIMYLALMTRILTNTFQNKTLISCLKEDLQAISLEDDLVTVMDFTEFYKLSSKTKNYKVKEMFVKQLLQIKGVSVDKALGIVEKYPSPRSLYMAYQQNQGSFGEKLLANVPFGPLKKNIGAAISKIIYQLFNNDTLL